MLILAWCWCENSSTETAARSADCSINSAAEQYSQCRRVCFAALDDRVNCPEAALMGGPDQLVQIDECSVKGKRKRAANGRGRLLPGDLQEARRGNAAQQAEIAAGGGDEEDEDYEEFEYDENNPPPEGWVFGIAWWRSVEEKRLGTAIETRFFAVLRRDAETLIGLIRKHVAPGTQIWSDCWRSYVRIDQQPEGYIHHTVNHSEYFTDPVTGVNTNTIEASWNRLRHDLVRTKRGVGRELRYHLAEAWWKSLMRVPCNRNRTKTAPRIFMNFLNLISRVYPL